MLSAFVLCYMTDSLMLPKVENFIFGGVNVMNLLFLLLSLPCARVGLTICKKTGLQLHHLGLQVD